MTRWMNSWSQIDEEGTLHIYLPNLLEALGLPQTPENVADAEEAVRVAMTECLPDVPYLGTVVD